MKKNVFFCIDFEEWFHIPYLKKYGFERNRFSTFSDKILPFMRWLKENDVCATVFVVADIANERKQTLKAISLMGHEIACHSYSHQSLNKMTKRSL